MIRHKGYRLLFFAAFFLLVAAGSGHCGQASQGENGGPAGKIALFPFDNFSDENDALIGIMPVLRDQLEKKGLEILDEDSLNKFMLKERVRATGYISRDLARKLAKDLNVKAVLLGSVNAFDAKGSPVVGLSSRLIDSSSGLILWADSVSATGEDFTSVLGMGKIETIDRLIPVVVRKLISSISLSPPHREIESSYRIAVMPFQNRSKVRDAGMIVTYFSLVELFKNPRFVPVEYGDVRRSVIELRIRQKGELDYKTLQSIAETLGVDGILIGTVEAYSDKTETNTPPEAAINIRLIDARKKKILWYDSLQLDGDEGIYVFDWGKLRSADRVAYKVTSKLVKRMEKAKWY